LFKHCGAATANLDEGDPNYEREFAYKRNVNTTNFAKSNQPAKQTTFQEYV
jgi:hypothetical protein